MNPNINNICSFPTSIAEGHLYQSFYHQRMGLLRLGLVSECRVTKNTANDTYFPILFFYFSNIIVERFKTTLTSDDAKQKKWFMIPKVASNPDTWNVDVSTAIFTVSVFRWLLNHKMTNFDHWEPTNRVQLWWLSSTRIILDFAKTQIEPSSPTSLNKDK